MPVVLDANPASASANSYATIAVADAYHAERLYSSVAWAAFSDVIKDQRLITATSLLDVHKRWKGTPAATTQPLGWPRDGTTTRNGGTIANTAFPLSVQHATAEFAYRLPTTDPAGGLPATLRSLQLRKAKIDVLEFEFKDDEESAGRQAANIVVPDEVCAMIDHLTLSADAFNIVSAGLVETPCFTRAMWGTSWD